jgi:thiamine biosynthesis lipoprotein
MGMPITIEVVGQSVTDTDIEKVFEYFNYIDEKFSTYKPGSEISQINQKKLTENNYSQDMKTVLALSETTKKQTNGYFDIWHKGICDPSGLVKGWAINNAAELLEKQGCKNFYVEAGGDIEACGKNSSGGPWTVGIKNPFKHNEIIKVVKLDDSGMATSGTYIRGQHIYNPLNDREITDIVSLTIIAANVYEADRFATAAFAMGTEGINFIEKMPGLEGYMINKDGIATMTTGFGKHTLQ